MSFHLVRICVLVICGWIAAGPAQAQQASEKAGAVTATLVADTSAIAPGKPFTAGVRFDIEPGWNIYWQFGGDIVKPTIIEWELPDGFTAGPMQWPVPESHRDDVTEAFNYVLHGEGFAFAEITPPSRLPDGPIVLKAKVAWQMCSPGVCKPGHAELASTLTAGEATTTNADAFTRWRAQSPKNSPPPFTVKWDRSSPRQVALQLEGLPKEFAAEFFPLPSAGVMTGTPQQGRVRPDGTRTITIPITKGGAPNLDWRGVIATRQGSGPREGWIIEAAGAPAFDAATAVSTALTTREILALLGSAFLGGLILNLMPCVLPVIALKIFGFVQQAGEEPRRVFRLGLAFVGGVFAFFLGLAALIVGLKSFGIELNWGFQFQNPAILLGLIFLVFVFALNLLGVFEITLAGGAASKLGALAGRDGYAGAFVHGVLTTLLGTSCTAPFLGTVLGFAFVAPPHFVFAIFFAIAIGMSLPYFLLTAKPAWMRFLPKPSAWMERLKQLMGFIMLGVVIWLLGIYAGASEEVGRLTALGGFLLVLAVACWIHGVYGRRLASWSAITILLAGGAFLFLTGQFRPRIAWEPWSEKRVEEATSQGQTVFVDFTASWCLNCQTNERLVIETEEVREALERKNVLPLKADFTREDPAILAELQKYGRAGVPAYLICPAGKTECEVLPEILNKGDLLARLEQLP